MNCTYHIRNQVSFICTDPHKCQCFRKLCTQCQYKHGVDLKYTIPIEIFEDMVKEKFQGSSLNSTSELIEQRINFKRMLSSTLDMLKQIWDKVAESIKQIYDLIEMQDMPYFNFNNVNPTELSNTDLERLVQIIIGKPLDGQNNQTNSYLKRLEMKKKYWEMETKGFCEKLNKEIQEIDSLINKTDNSQQNIQQLKEINQVYSRKQDFYQVLTQTKYFDGLYLNELFQLLKNQKITNCLDFFKNQTQLRFIASLIQNVAEIDFNKKNYSTENNDQIRKELIKKIDQEKQIIEFLKFLVYLTAIDEGFIQCGSNSFNLLVEMKVDLREQCFENIRIRDTSLAGGNFVKCNFNGSEFDNVDISGMNLNYAQLFNCKWKNIKINESNKLDCPSSTVTSVKISPDGTTLASGSDDNFIRLWDIKTGQLKAKLDGHSSSVWSVNFSPDGATLASGSYDNSIRLWDAKTGEQKAKLDCHQNGVYSVNFSPDGTTLATGSNDNSIRLWDVKTGQQKSKLDGHEDSVKSVNFSPDGSTIASGSLDKSIRLWDVKTGQQKAQLDGHLGFVYSVNFSPDGTTLASGSLDKSIRLWDVKTRLQKAQLDGHSDYVTSVDFSPDGTTLASGSGDKSMCLWDVKTGQQIAKLVHSNCVNSICYSSDGTTLASGSQDNSIRLWDVKARQQKAKLDGHSASVYQVYFSPDGTTIASGSLDKSIRFWDVKTGQQIQQSDNHYKDILAQLQPSIFNNIVLPECATSIITILRILQNPNLEAEGALILRGEFVNYQGVDLKSLLKSKGSCILENYIEKKQN